MAEKLKISGDKVDSICALCSKYIFTNVGYNYMLYANTWKNQKKTLNVLYLKYSANWVRFSEIFILGKIPCVVLTYSSGTYNILEEHYRTEFLSNYLIPCPYAIVCLDVL